VRVAQSMDQTFIDSKAKITLVGVAGNLATCDIEQKKVSFGFKPTDLTFTHTAASQTVEVTLSNVGTISSELEATSLTEGSSDDWCTVSVSGTTVTVSVTDNSSNTSRSTKVYVTYNNCKSDQFTVTQESNGPSTVTIGGVEWTEYNLGNPYFNSNGAPLTGSMATAKPSAITGTREDSHGKFYQWNINVAWSTTTPSASGATPSGSWQTSASSAATWSKSPCPSGFMLPTSSEWSSLINTCTKTYMSGTWSSTNYGYLTLKSGSVSLEFPAVGLRSNSSGSLGGNGTNGYYWSSTQGNSTGAYYMSFNGSSAYASDTNSKAYGFSVRCVRQNK